MMEFKELASSNATCLPGMVKEQLKTEEQLKRELDLILSLKKDRERELQELQVEVARRQEETRLYESALAESRRIAYEIEEEARIKATRCLQDAKGRAEANAKRLAALEEEIAGLQREWELCREIVQRELAARKREGLENGSTPREQILGAEREKKEEKQKPEAVKFREPWRLFKHPATKRNLKAAGGRLRHVRLEPVPPGEGSAEDGVLYTIKLVSFVNARHYVEFSSGRGPLHAHSWQFQVEIKVPSEKREIIEFARVVDAVRRVLEPYENAVLNQLYPFTFIQPSTENIAFYFFSKLEETLAQLGLVLGKLTVWETPVRGVEVSSRNAEFDALLQRNQEEKPETTGSVKTALKEAAAAEESILAAAPPAEAEGPAPATVPSEERRSYRWYSYLTSASLIALFALLAYFKILFPPLEQHYPWGSDTWGHLFKAEYLYQKILEGNYYPQFTEYWYSGSQPFRYWAPLPYYVLALLRFFTGNIFTAGNYYLFLCALLGAWGWLFLAPRLGLWPSVIAGMVWCVWQDNLRVAFSEGNLPRVLAIAFLPYFLAAYLRVLERPKDYFPAVAVIVLAHLTILCHAMIGAAYFISLSFFTFFLWVFHGCQIIDGIRGVAVLTVGVASSAWWLLPALSGGITQIDPQAVKETIQFVSPMISFNPLVRFENREVFYWGISFGLALLWTFATWHSRPPWSKSLTVCGLLLVLVTFPVFRSLYILFPLSHLIWPLRFSSFAGMAVLAAALGFNPLSQRAPLWRSPIATGVAVAVMFSVFMIDCAFSWRLMAYTSTNAYSIVESSRILKERAGWRVATLDLSRLGSSPSFLFTELAGREQLFGWAWQGAVTSNNIMLLNTGLEFQHYPFLMRSCLCLGATDLVVKDDVLKNPALFRRAAEKAGYQYRGSLGGISFWHGASYPYLVEKKNNCLVIGKYAGIVALQFPSVEMGNSQYIDAYSLEYLKQYPLLILSGAGWKSKKYAEELIAGYVAAGGHLFVELAGMPLNVLAKQPEFLGVYGEPVVLNGQIELKKGEESLLLQPFSPQALPWKTYVPMGLDRVEWEFNYYGNQAPVLGYKLVNGRPVWFMGGNLIYHGFLTGDSAVAGLLQQILGLSTEYTPPNLIPLTEYRAEESGYTMTYEAKKSFKAIVPVAAMDGLKVEIDGIPQAHGCFENLVELDLPAGQHQIKIYLVPPPVYRHGALISILACVLALPGLYLIGRQAGKRER